MDTSRCQTMCSTCGPLGSGRGAANSPAARALLLHSQPRARPGLWLLPTPTLLQRPSALGQFLRQRKRSLCRKVILSQHAKQLFFPQKCAFTLSKSSPELFLRKFSFWKYFVLTLLLHLRRSQPAASEPLSLFLSLCELEAPSSPPRPAPAGTRFCLWHGGRALR